MKILAHRCYRDGPDAALENTQSALRDCLRLGYGVETDIRRTKTGQFYISHDQAGFVAGNDAAAFFADIKRFRDATIALNVKELGYEEVLLDFLRVQDVLTQIFLFDMELLEPRAGETAKRFRALSNAVKLAARVSDRNEPVSQAVAMPWTSIVWLDEFDSLWVTASDVGKLKDAGRDIYAISPEIHGFSKREMFRRWQEFQEWGIDGICTDYPDLLAQFLKDGKVPV